MSVVAKPRGPACATAGLRRWGCFTPTNGPDPNRWGALGIERERERTPVLLLVEARADVRVCSRAAP